MPMNRAEWAQIFGQGASQGAKAYDDQQAHSAALAQLLRGKQAELSNKKDEQANQVNLELGKQKAERATVENMHEQYPNMAIHSGNFSLTPKDNTVRNQGLADREDKNGAGETAALHAMLDKFAGKDVDALKGGQQVQAILADPNTMNKTALRIALTKAAGAGRISQFEVQNALGPESLYERATDLGHSITGQPETPFTDAQKAQLMSNYQASMAPHIQNVQKAMEAVKQLAPQLAPTLTKRGTIDSVMKAYTGPMDALYSQGQASQGAPPAPVPAQPKPSAMASLLGAKPQAPVAQAAPTAQSAVPATTAPAQPQMPPQQTPQAPQGAAQPPLSFEDFKRMKAAGQL